MIARIAPAVVIVCLLAAWQSALLHPLEHIDAQGRLVHVSDMHSGEDGRSSSDPSAKLCDALAALTACAAKALPGLATATSRHNAAPHRFAAPRPAAAPPFLAQGPPISL